MTNRILIGSILLLSTISCRKTQTVTSFDNSKIVKTYTTTQGKKYTQTISNFDVISGNWGTEKKMGTSWVYRVSTTAVANLHVSFSLKDRISKRSYSIPVGWSNVISSSNEFSLIYDGDSRATGGEFKITDLKTVNYQYYGEIWLVSGNWSGKMYDNNCGCEVDGSVTLYNVPFGKEK